LSISLHGIHNFSQKSSNSIEFVLLHFSAIAYIFVKFWFMANPKSLTNLLKYSFVFRAVLKLLG